MNLIHFKPFFLNSMHGRYAKVACTIPIHFWKYAKNRIYDLEYTNQYIEYGHPFYGSGKKLAIDSRVNRGQCIETNTVPTEKQKQTLISGFTFFLHLTKVYVIYCSFWSPSLSFFKSRNWWLVAHGHLIYPWMQCISGNPIYFPYNLL